jgi:hypothetical protein
MGGEIMENIVSETTSSVVKTGNEKTMEFTNKAEKALNDQIELVVSAWEKLFEYFKSIRDVGFRDSIEIPGLWLYWLNTDKVKGMFNTRFSFTNNSFRISEHAYGSSFDWECVLTEEGLKQQKEKLRDVKEYRYAVKKLVSEWSTVKPKIEENINKFMTEKMQKAESRMNNVLEMNDKLENFVA